MAVVRTCIIVVAFSACAWHARAQVSATMPDTTSPAFPSQELRDSVTAPDALRASDTVAPAVAPLTTHHLTQAELLNPEIHPKLWIGPSAGYELTFHAMSDPGVACTGDPICPKFTGGTGGGILFGASVDWRATEKYGLLARVMYSGSSVSMQATGSDIKTRDASGNVVTLVREHTLDASTPSLVIDLAANRDVGRFHLFAGPTIGMLMGAKWSAASHFVSPSNVTYMNGTTDTVYFPLQSVANLNTLQLGLTVGAGMNFPLARRWLLSPELSYTVPLLSVTSDHSWSMHAMRMVASARYALDRGCEMREERTARTTTDTVRQVRKHVFVETVIPGKPHTTDHVMEYECARVIESTTVRTDTLLIPDTLVAKLAMSGVDMRGRPVDHTSIKIRAQLVTEAFPLLPHVYFDSASSSIPSRYRSASAPAGFNEDSLKPEPVAMQHAVLAVLAARLKSDPSISIAVHGYADPETEDANCGLAMRRATAVKTFLVRDWGVPAAQVKLVDASGSDCAPPQATHTAREEGYAENRRVEITTKDSSILAPIVHRSFLEVQGISPPAVLCDPTGSTTDDIVSAVTTLDQGNGGIVFDTIKGPAQLRRFTVDTTRIGKLIPGTEMRSTLTITDSGGRTASAVAVGMAVQSDTVGIEIQRLSLALFEVSQDRIRNRDRAAIKSFLAGVDSSAEVVIRGYTDNLGDSLYNTELSAKRCLSVALYIGKIAPNAKITHVDGLGMIRRPPGIQSYDLPEERSLCRTVQIEVRKARRPS